MTMNYTTTESLRAEGKCGVMIHTRGFDGHGSIYCAEPAPCRFHVKGKDGLSKFERESLINVKE